MTVAPEELIVGAFVHWVGDRYVTQWDIMGKIVKVRSYRPDHVTIKTEVTILGYDNFELTTIGLETALKECTIATRDEALKYFDDILESRYQVLLDKQKEMNILVSELKKRENERLNTF